MKPILVGELARSEMDVHAAILKAEAAAARQRKPREVAGVTIEGMGAPWVVPQRLAASCLYAARKAHGESVRVGGKAQSRVDLAEVCTRALKLLLPER